MKLYFSVNVRIIIIFNIKVIYIPPHDRIRIGWHHNFFHIIHIIIGVYTHFVTASHWDSKNSGLSRRSLMHVRGNMIWYPTKVRFRNNNIIIYTGGFQYLLLFRCSKRVSWLIYTKLKNGFFMNIENCNILRFVFNSI